MKGQRHRVIKCDASMGMWVNMTAYFSSFNLLVHFIKTANAQMISQPGNLFY